MRVLRVLCLGFCAITVALTSCEREQRRFEVPPSTVEEVKTVRLSELRPGLAAPTTPTTSSYDDSTYAIAEGKRLYTWFSCAGCHFQGGGGIGPPLMDDQWIYGGAPENIFASIVEGRPNGMPSFHGRIPTVQVWQLVAYVRTLSGPGAKDAARGRRDQ